MKIERGVNKNGERITTVFSNLDLSDGDISCSMEEQGSDNDSASFELVVKDSGQIEGGRIKMLGGVERAALLDFFKQLVYEMELLSK